MERSVRIVVAEGPNGRNGLLRFVLESEGYDVVGEASSAPDLAHALKTHDPDVVVMDDGIGATAVGMTHDLAPDAKVVLIWPEAVVPIGGDAAVEPSAVLRRLGPTVEGLTGVPSASGRMGARHGAGILSLGAILAMGRAAGSERATPADRPASTRPGPADAIIDDRGESPVLILPDGPGAVPTAADADAAISGPLTLSELEHAEHDDAVPIADVAAMAGAGVAAGAVAAAGAPAETGVATATAASGAAAVAATGARARRNRSLGTLALGGAALAGSLVLALSLSGSRVPSEGVRGEGPGVTPPSISASPVVPPPQAVVIPGALLGDLGGSGTTLTFVRSDAAAGTGTRAGVGGPGGTGGTGGGGGPTPPAGSGGGNGSGSGSVGSGGGGGGTGGPGPAPGGGGSPGGGKGGKVGGGDCLPRGGDVGQPCGLDDDGLDGHGPGDHGGNAQLNRGGDHSGESHGHGGDHSGDQGGDHSGDQGGGQGGDHSGDQSGGQGGDQSGDHSGGQSGDQSGDQSGGQGGDGN